MGAYRHGHYNFFMSQVLLTIENTAFAGLQYCHILLDTITSILFNFYVVSLIDDRKIRHLHVYNPFLFFGFNLSLTLKRQVRYFFAQFRAPPPSGEADCVLSLKRRLASLLPPFRLHHDFVTIVL